MDDSYDFTKDIVLDMNVDISLPVGSSKFIAIGDFLKTDEASDAGTGNLIVKDGNGNYVLRVNCEKPAVASIPVPSFNFEGQTLKTTEAGFNMEPAYVGKNPADIQGETKKEYKIHTSDGDEARMSVKIDSELPSEVLDIRSAEVNSEISFVFSIGSGRLTLKKGVVITFPDYITLEPAEPFKDRISIRDGHIVTTLQDIAVLPNDNTSSIKMTVRQFNLESVPGHGIVENGVGRSIVLNDNVVITGDVIIDAKDFNPVPAMVKISMNVRIDTIEVESAEARLNIYEEIEEQSVDIDDIPDFFGGDVKLDLWNPLMWLKMDNGVPFTTFLNVDLRAYDGNVQSSSVHIGSDGPADNRTEPVMLPKGKGRLTISRQGNPSSAAEDTDIVVPGLARLLETIPDKFVVDNLTVSSDPDIFTKVEFVESSDGNYGIEMEYGLDVPLAFGRNMYLLYNTDIKGWNSTFAGNGEDETGDSNVSLKKIEVKYTVMNTIPLNVAFEAIPVDVDGNAIADGIEVGIEGGADAGTEDNPVYSPVKITLSAETDAARTLDGIRLSVKLTGSDKSGIEGHTLNDRHGIQLLGMSARIAGSFSATLSKEYNDNDND